MEIPTKRVLIVATGLEATINVSDFDPLRFIEIVDAAPEVPSPAPPDAAPAEEATASEPAPTAPTSEPAAAPSAATTKKRKGA